MTTAVRDGEPDIVLELRFDPTWLGSAWRSATAARKCLFRSWLAANYAWIDPSGRGLWIVEACPPAEA